MSNKFASQLEQIRILSNKKKVVDDKVAELSAVMDYWQPFIKQIQELSVADVPPIYYYISESHPDYKPTINLAGRILPQGYFWKSGTNNNVTFGRQQVELSCSPTGTKKDAECKADLLKKDLPDYNDWGGYVFPSTFNTSSYEIKRYTNRGYWTPNAFSLNVKELDAPPRKRLIDNFNNIVFELQQKINQLKRTDNAINVKAASKLQRMLNNFRGATAKDKIEVEDGTWYITPEQLTTLPKERPPYKSPYRGSIVGKLPKVKVNGLPITAMHNRFYNTQGVHSGMNNVVEFMYKAFPETNVRDIDNVLKQNQTLSDKYYNEMLVQQNQIIRQGGTFNLDTPPNVGDAGTAPQNEKATTSKTKITPLQKGMIALSVLLLVSGVTIALLKSD